LETSHVRSGSISTKLDYPGDVRFSPDSDRTADIVVGPVRANSRSSWLPDSRVCWSFRIGDMHDRQYS
jgi:hypothetical protein